MHYTELLSKSRKLISTANKLGEDENCNFCADFVFYPTEETAILQDCGKAAVAVSIPLPYNRCQQLLITTNGVLTDCITRSLQKRRRQLSFREFKIPKRKQLFDPFCHGNGQLAEAASTSDKKDRKCKPPFVKENTHFRSRSIADDWVVIDVKSKK